MASADIFGVIVSELRYKKKPCPIIPFEVNKSLEVGFYCIILPFSLAIRLRVEDGGEFSLNVEEIA